MVSAEALSRVLKDHGSNKNYRIRGIRSLIKRYMGRLPPKSRGMYQCDLKLTILLMEFQDICWIFKRLPNMFRVFAFKIVCVWCQRRIDVFCRMLQLENTKLLLRIHYMGLGFIWHLIFIGFLCCIIFRINCYLRKNPELLLTHLFLNL